MTVPEIDSCATQIITDDLCDTVYVSSYLGKKSLENDYAGIGLLFTMLKDILVKHNIPLRELSNTNDIWVRDFMPVQITEDHFWEYIYDPDYLQAKEAKYITNYKDVTYRGKKLFVNSNCQPIVADGGNVVKCNDFVIMTDKVFGDLLNLKRRLSWIELKKSIGVDVVIIPRENDSQEHLGHADGMVHYIAHDKVLFRAPQSLEDKAFLTDVITQFKRQKPDVEILQFDFSSVPYAQQCPENWAYINFLRVRNLIVLPKLSTDNEIVVEDEIALEQMKKLLPYCTFEQIPMREFIKSGGGALNCISWTIKSFG